MIQRTLGALWLQRGFLPVRSSLTLQGRLPHYVIKRRVGVRRHGDAAAGGGAWHPHVAQAASGQFGPSSRQLVRLMWKPQYACICLLGNVFVWTVVVWKRYKLAVRVAIVV